MNSKDLEGKDVLIKALIPLSFIVLMGIAVLASVKIQRFVLQEDSSVKTVKPLVYIVMGASIFMIISFTLSFTISN